MRFEKLDGYPNSRDDARAVGAKNYFTGIACKNGHLYLRNTISGRCLSCDADRMKRKYAEDPEYVKYAKSYQKGRREADPSYSERNTKRFMEKYYGNEDFRTEYLAKLRDRNLNDPKFRAMRKRSRRKYVDSNPDKVASYNQAKRAASRLATPTWLSAEQLEAIYEVYARARKLREETGDPYEVDHIVPLKGKRVCGLHVPWNLQVLPRLTNRSKFNRLENDWLVNI